MASFLFASDSQQTNSSAETLCLPDAQLHWFPSFMDVEAANATLQQLRDTTPWRQDNIRMHGRTLPVPRLQAWYGSPAARYGYSGILLDPLPLTPLLDNIRSRIEEACRSRFNAVLLNWYRDGQDSVSWHSDDEPELGSDPVIASLSLGVTRRFELRHRQRTDLGKLTLDLSHGSLLLMDKGVQTHWQHRIPKQPGITGTRLNLTFRLLG